MVLYTGLVAVAGLVVVAGLVAAVLLYRRRRSECGLDAVDSSALTGDFKTSTGGGSLDTARTSLVSWNRNTRLEERWAEVVLHPELFYSVCDGSNLQPPVPW